MSRRTKVWLAVAILFTVVNVGGAIYAAALSEMSHAGTHVALTIVGGYFVRRLLRRDNSDHDAEVQPPADRIEQLQQSVDAVALEVERIGEAQRYHEKLRAEKVGNQG